MEILWLVVGFILGVLMAWFYFGHQHKKRLAEREAEFLQGSRVAREALETERQRHQETRQSLSETEASEASAKEPASSLQADLATADDKLKNERIGHKETKQLLSDLGSREALAVERADALESDLDKNRSALKKATAADSERSAKLKQLQSENEDLGARLNSADAARASAEQARERLDEQLKEVQTESHAATEQSRTQIIELQERLSQQDAEVRRLEAEFTAVQAEVGDQKGVETADAASGAIPLHAAAVSASRPSDDLTKISGIGKVLNEKLLKLGVTSFQQIAVFTPADIDRVNAVLDFPGRIEREQWVEQARAIVLKSHR